jgi:hypothetical protein
MEEDVFVQEALAAAEEILAPPLLIRRHAPLLYQVTVNNRLEVTVDPRHLARGQSAFQTDLCVFEDVDEDVRIPRVVMEFKSRITTHDVITYSAKARKHKQVYPYLRYGVIIANEATVPGRFFTHNEALDFCVAAASYKVKRVHEILATLLRDEVAASRRLERIAFEKTPVHVFRSEIVLEGGTGKVA